MQKLPTHNLAHAFPPGHPLSRPQLAWFLRKRRRRRNGQNNNNPWFHFRAQDLPGGDGTPVSLIPNSTGDSKTLSLAPLGSPPLLAGAGTISIAGKAIYFDPNTGNNSLLFSENFTSTSSTIIVVAWATNVELGDQGLVVCSNTALYAVQGGGPEFGFRWGCYVRDQADSGFSWDSSFKVLTLRVNEDASFDMFDMETKVSFAAQPGSFPSRPGSAIGADPSGVQQFQGYIAELFIYDRPLSDADILTTVAEMRAYHEF